MCICVELLVCIYVEYASVYLCICVECASVYLC